MRFLHCVLAEAALVAPRFTRTRLGISLLVLGITLIWLGERGFDPLTLALLAGSLGAILTAAGVAGTDNERRALTIALGHPTTPLAIATGRWLASIVPALVLVQTVTAAGGSTARTALAGFAAAGAVGSLGLVLVIALGSPAAIALFLLMAVAGSIEPERLVALAHPGVVRLAAASVLELGPALWHYRDIATGDRGGSALAHALAWTGLGILLASACIGRRRALDRHPITND